MKISTRTILTRPLQLVAAAAILLGVLFVAKRSYDGALLERGRAIERAAQVASQGKVIQQRYDSARVQVIHDTLRAVRTITRWQRVRDSLVDTTHVQVSDTVQVLVQQGNALSDTLRACVQTCQDFRLTAQARIGSLESQLAASLAAQRPSWQEKTATATKWIGVGIVVKTLVDLLRK